MGPRKSGIPAEVDIPAPVIATIWRLWRNNSSNFSNLTENRKVIEEGNVKGQIISLYFLNHPIFHLIQAYQLSLYEESKKGFQSKTNSFS